MVRSAHKDAIRARGGYVVAASDSSADSKRSADIVCRGVNDHVQINEAIAKLPTTGDKDVKGSGQVTRKNQGGCIQLTEGSFKLGASVDFSGLSNITLQGLGPSTVVHNENTSGAHAIQAINAPVSNQVPDRCLIRDMIIQGNASSGDGVHIVGIEYLRISGLHCQDNGVNGAYLESLVGSGDPGGDNPTIDHCQFQFNGQDGLHIVELHDLVVGNIHVEENGRHGIYGDTIILNVTNANIEDHASGNGINVVGSGNLTNCQIEDSVFFNSGVGGSVNLDQCNVSGTFEVDTNTGGSPSVRITGGTVLASDLILDVHNLYVSGAQLNKITILDVNSSCILDGSVLVFNPGDSTTIGATTIAEMNITGCRITMATTDSYTFTANANNMQMSFCDNTVRNGRLIFDGNGNSDLRFTYSGNNVRTSDVTFEDVAHFVGGQNMIVGSGAGDVHTWINCDTTLNFSVNTLRNCGIDFQATCGARGLFACNVGSALTLTNNATDVRVLLADIDTGEMNHTS